MGLSVQLGPTCCLESRSEPAFPATPGSAVERLLATAPASCHPRLRELSARRIDDVDLAFLSELYASTRADEVAATGWPEEARRQFLAQQFQFQHRYYQEHYADADFLLLSLQGRPIGRLYWQGWPGAASLIDISLVPPQRGRGLGSALLGLLLAQADLDGRTVDLHVEPDNPARRLYKRLGFTVAGHAGVYLRMQRRPPYVATSGA
jgi:ribosomal protein S18 acetylase RimI-like enzyme